MSRQDYIRAAGLLKRSKDTGIITAAEHARAINIFEAFFKTSEAPDFEPDRFRKAAGLYEANALRN